MDAASESAGANMGLSSGRTVEGRARCHSTGPTWGAGKGPFDRFAAAAAAVAVAPLEHENGGFFPPCIARVSSQDLRASDAHPLAKTAGTSDDDQTHSGTGQIARPPKAARGAYVADRPRTAPLPPVGQTLSL